jgi:hypothetical protein
MLDESIRSCQLYQLMASLGSSAKCYFFGSQLRFSLPVSIMSITQPNGTINQPQSSKAPPVVGINFGNSYASIAVLNKVWTIFNRGLWLR